MDKVTLKALARGKSGKCALKKMRTEGQIPGIVYGHGDEPVMVSVSAAEFNKTVFSCQPAYYPFGFHSGSQRG